MDHGTLVEERVQSYREDFIGSSHVGTFIFQNSFLNLLDQALRQLVLAHRCVYNLGSYMYGDLRPPPQASTNRK